MLVHFHWDAKTLVEIFLCDPKAVRRSIGLHAKSRPPFLRYDLFGPNKPVPAGVEAAADTGFSVYRTTSDDIADTELECTICCCSMHPQDCFALQCEHWYCRGCWQAYIRTHVIDKEVAIRCMGNKCKSLISSSLIDFLCEPDVVRGYQKNLLKAFVEDKHGRTRISYCKNPSGCEGITILADDALVEVSTCKLCGFTFCADCDMMQHAPATCAIVKEWCLSVF
jgi:hypothetical protein